MDYNTCHYITPLVICQSDGDAGCILLLWRNWVSESLFRGCGLDKLWRRNHHFAVTPCPTKQRAPRLQGNNGCARGISSRRRIWIVKMRKTVLLLIMLCCLAGCAVTSTSLPGRTPSATATLSPTATSSPIPSPTPAATPTSLPQPTSTPTLTPTATSTPTPTSTPLPSVVLGQDVAMAPWARPLAAQLIDLPGYAITATIDLEALTVSGQQRVVYTNRHDWALAELYFHLYPNAPRFGQEMTIGHVAVNGQPVEIIYENRRRVLRVPLDPPLTPGARVSIEMDFTLSVLSLDKNDLRTLVYSKGVLSLGGWYPALAVLDRTGWHLDYHSEIIGEAMFAESAFYTVDLVAPQSLTLAVTGVQVKEMLLDHGLRAVSYVSGPVRTLYIVGAEDYEVLSEQWGDVAIRSYYRPDHAKCGQWVLDSARAALELYSELYGPYPFVEFKVVEADYDYQGFEWPGLVLIGDMLYEGSGPACGEWFVAHETAHQWWYSAVGNDPVNHPWLDEALAQYSTMLYYRRLWDAAAAEVYIQAIVYDRFAPYAEQPTIHIDQPTLAFSDTKDYFAIVYARGAMFVEQVHKLLGDEAFFAAMQQYYQDNLFGIAGPEDLYRVFVAANPEGVKALWAEWVSGKWESE